MCIYRIYNTNMAYSLLLQPVQVGMGRRSRGVTQLTAETKRDNRI